MRSYVLSAEVVEALVYSSDAVQRASYYLRAR
jgi:hypothetical protein